MKVNVLKLATALVSLVIGYALVHSFSPRQEESLAIKQSAVELFSFANDTEVLLDCVYGTAPYEVHFSAYQRPEIKQPGVDYRRAFCNKLPSLGATKITLDFIDQGLRERSVGLKFIYHQKTKPGVERSLRETVVGEMTDDIAGEVNREVSGEINGEVVSESFQTGIPRGLIQSRLDFVKPGFYTLVVAFGGGLASTNEVVSIPFEVGASL